MSTVPKHTESASVRKWRRERGLRNLAMELRHFSPAGLRSLEMDLRYNSIVYPCSWSACPLSYRNGCRGSVSRSSDNRPRTAFTEAYDVGAIPNSLVLQHVQEELARRAELEEEYLEHESLELVAV